MNLINEKSHQPVREMIAFRQDGFSFFVLLEDGKAAEVLSQKEQTKPILNQKDLVLGRVRRVLPALGGVFIDVGEEHDALLPFCEAPPNVKEGRPLIVQVRRQMPEHKGHQVTTAIELVGPYAVFFPDRKPKQRSKLQNMPKNMKEPLYQRDLCRLSQIWSDLMEESSSGPVPRLLYAQGDPLHIALTAWVGPDLKRIRTDDASLYQAMEEKLKELMPEFMPLLRYERPDGDFGLAAILGLATLTEDLKKRRVFLDNGGFIVIDRTEALTVIDVNSGCDIKGKSEADLRLRTNLLAAEEIARQLRLRNIGGMVLIDFLRLKRKEDQQRIEEALKNHFLRDRARVKLYGFSQMGLFELVRTAV